MSRTWFTSGPLTLYLYGPAHGWPKAERIDACHRTRDILGQLPFQAHLQAPTRRHILGDHHSLSERVIRRLNVKRQIKSNRTATDIGAPMRYVGIIGQQIIQLLGGIVCSVDGCILAELQVHHELGTIR